MLHTFCLKKTNKPFIGQARMIVEIEGKMLKNFKKFSTLVFFLVAVCSSFTFAMESNSSADIGGGNPQRKRSVSNAGLATATRDQIVKDALLHQFGEHHYAIATTDTAFKHMLSISMGSDPSIVISFLNCFVPPFRGDPVVEVKEAPVAIPALRQSGEKQTFMDLHVVCSKGTHYIIEMQAQRHVMFDERALFYACGTYARQLSERELSAENWYINLKPVIALQILGYDTNRIRGLKAEVPDTLVGKVKEHPLPPEQFIKHYILSDKSGQQIDYLQMIQVELPRAEKIRSLFPPQADFSLADWWVSVLHHAQDYTSEKVTQWYNAGAGIMPTEIYNALNRLDLQQWNPGITSEYRENLANRELYAATLAVEYEDGEKAGMEKGEKKAKREAIVGMRAISLNDTLICQALQITEQQLQELITEEEI
jgi:hypothetical protein